MNRLYRIWVASERWAAGFSLLLITTLVLIDIASREVFDQSLPWTSRSAVYLMVFAGFLGSTLTSAKGKHLRAELADKLWPAKMQPFYQMVQHLLQALFGFAACYVSIVYVAESMEFGDREVVLDIPLWYLQLVIPYTFFSIGLKHSLFALRPELLPPTKGAH